MNNRKQKRVAVIGSYRKGKEKYSSYCFSENNFEKACISLGKQLRSMKNVTLISAWSNDFQHEQVQSGDYYYENTADYLALKGYLAEDANSNNPPVCLLMSLRLKVILTEIMPALKLKLKDDNELIKTLRNNELCIQKRLNYFSEFGNETWFDILKILLIEQKTKWDGAGYLAYLLERGENILFTDKNGISEFNNRITIQAESIADDSLRSEMLKYNLIPSVDIAIFLGGGKAQIFAIEEIFKWKWKIPIFITMCGGAVEKFLSDYKNKGKDTPKYWRDRILKSCVLDGTNDIVKTINILRREYECKYYTKKFMGFATGIVTSLLLDIPGYVKDFLLYILEPVKDLWRHFLDIWLPQIWFYICNLWSSF